MTPSSNYPACRRFQNSTGLSGQRLERSLRSQRIPTQIVTLLNEQANLALADPKIKEHIANLGGVALPSSIGGLSPNYRGRYCEMGRGGAILRRARRLIREKLVNIAPIRERAPRAGATSRSCVRVDIVQGSITSYPACASRFCSVAISRHLVAAQIPSKRATTGRMHCKEELTRQPWHWLSYW